MQKIIHTKDRKHGSGVILVLLCVLLVWSVWSIYKRAYHQNDLYYFVDEAEVEDFDVFWLFK